MKREKWAGGWWVGGLMERQRWETEGRKRGGRYSHVINDKWWQSVGGGGGAGRLHGSLPAERLLLGGGVEEEEEDTPGTLSDLLLLPSRARNFSPQRPKTVKTNRFSQLRKFGLFN